MVLATTGINGPYPSYLQLADSNLTATLLFPVVHPRHLGTLLLSSIRMHLAHARWPTLPTSATVATPF